MLALKNLPHKFKLLRKYLHTDVNVVINNNSSVKNNLNENGQEEKDVMEKEEIYEVEKEVEVERVVGEGKVKKEKGNEKIKEVAADWRGSWIEILKHDILHPRSSSS